jgi:hypothetical protein
MVRSENIDSHDRGFVFPVKRYHQEFEEIVGSFWMKDVEAWEADKASGDIRLRWIGRTGALGGVVLTLF